MITLSLLTRLVIIILDKSVDNILIGTRAKQSIHKKFRHISIYIYIYIYIHSSYMYWLSQKVRRVDNVL